MEWLMSLAEDGHDVPALEKRPVLYDDLAADYSAFWALSASRPSGFGASPIPLTEILAYMEMFEIDDPMCRKLFLERMRVMDRAFMDWAKKRGGRSRRSKKGKT